MNAPGLPVILILVTDRALLPVTVLSIDAHYLRRAPEGEGKVWQSPLRV